VREVVTPPRKTDEQGREIYPTETDIQARLRALATAGIVTGYVRVPGGFVLRYNPEVIR
jgi:hypothetical protein